MARFFVPFLVPFVLFTQASIAKPNDPREIQARKDCLLGRVESGVALLVELFTDTQNPVFLFNQGRCYQQNARAAEALKAFKEYLRVDTDISPQIRATVEQHMAECRAMLAEHESKSKVQEPSPVALDVADTTPKRADELPANDGATRSDLTSQPQPASTAGNDSSIFSRWWFWTSAAVVVVGGVTAALLLTRGSGTTIPENTLGSQRAF